MEILLLPSAATATARTAAGSSSEDSVESGEMRVGPSSVRSTMQRLRLPELRFWRLGRCCCCPLLEEAAAATAASEEEEEEEEFEELHVRIMRGGEGGDGGVTLSSKR